MKIRSVLLLVLILLLSGCGTEADLEPVVENFEPADKIVSLVDVDFTTVPDFTYHILLEEKMSPNKKQFIRRYVRYNGIKNTATEVLQEVALPERQHDVNGAKNWLQENDPDKLVVYCQTYLSDSVQAQWEDSDYDFYIEEAQLISLEGLKKLGAISRLNEIFVINKKPEEMVELIEAVEADFLKPAPNLLIERELEALPRSFSYQLQLQLGTEPTKKPSTILCTAKIILMYQIDELGNPIELNFEASFEDHTKQGSQSWLPGTNQVGIFMVEMRNSLISRLDLFGVTPYNPTLAYANVTLNYEGIAHDNLLTERIYIP
ncbi:MAG TPA: hypothetical protein VFC74_04220 [Oscillospiraceae bacterium]|nr:hypothetical protein [Oscillospiraceae bacterium]